MIAFWTLSPEQEQEEQEQVFRDMWLTAGIFIRAVVAVLVAVAEEAPLDAIAVAAGQIVFLANGLIGEQKRFHFLLLGLSVAVFNRVLPIAGLLLDVEGETRGATDGLQTLQTNTTSIILYTKVSI